MLVIQDTMSFLLKFFSYDKQLEAVDVDYPLETGFTRVYTATTDITFSFPNQIMLSLQQPSPFRDLKHYQEDELDHSTDFPTDTYAYTTTTPLIIKYDRPVSFEYLWIRAHRSPQAFMAKSKGYRWVRVYSEGIMVSESTFLVYSDEWLLLKPSYSSLGIIGDMLVVQENTDVDSIQITFGGGINQKLNISDQKKQEFYGFTVVDNLEPGHKYKYRL